MKGDVQHGFNVRVDKALNTYQTRKEINKVTTTFVASDKLNISYKIQYLRKGPHKNVDCK